MSVRINVMYKTSYSNLTKALNEVLRCANLERSAVYAITSFSYAGNAVMNS